jgi:multimeric flavodoxin WrbA
MLAAIYGSPRKGGNTDIIMDSFLNAFADGMEIRRIYLRDSTLIPCDSCGACNHTGTCKYKDDISDIYKIVEQAKAVVLCSPIYFTSVTAQMKSFIDRAQPFWVRKYLMKYGDRNTSRKGFYLSAGAFDTEKQFKSSVLVIKAFMACLDIEYCGDLFYPCIDAKGDIRKVDGAIERAADAGLEFKEKLKISNLT